jgi:hypothetical protein
MAAVIPCPSRTAEISDWLLDAERLHRLDRSRTAGRYPPCDKGAEAQDESRHAEDEGIEAAYTVELMRERAARKQGER